MCMDNFDSFILKTIQRIISKFEMAAKYMCDVLKAHVDAVKATWWLNADFKRYSELEEIHCKSTALNRYEIGSFSEIDQSPNCGTSFDKSLQTSFYSKYLDLNFYFFWLTVHLKMCASRSFIE